MSDDTGTQAMWPQMIAALAAIDAELGIDDDGCNTTARTLAAIKALKAAVKDLTHQVICCGVAASHSDPTLTTRGAYAGKWNSAQAEEVRKLRAERDKFHSALLDCARKAEALKRECGMDPESPQAVRNGQYMAISIAAHVALGTIRGPCDA